MMMMPFFTAVSIVVSFILIIAMNAKQSAAAAGHQKHYAGNYRGGYFI
jgi:hypothetical protein